MSEIKICQDPNCDEQDWTLTRIKEWNHMKRIWSGSKVRSHLNTHWTEAESFQNLLKSRVELLFGFSTVSSSSTRRWSSSPQYSEVIRLHCRVRIDLSLSGGVNFSKKKEATSYLREYFHFLWNHFLQQGWRLHWSCDCNQPVKLKSITPLFPS